MRRKKERKNIARIVDAADDADAGARGRGRDSSRTLDETLKRNGCLMIDIRSSVPTETNVAKFKTIDRQN